MNTTLLNFRVTDQVKDDFMTTCRLNCTSMTSEIVRFMNQYMKHMEIWLKIQLPKLGLRKVTGRLDYDWVRIK